MTWKDGFEYAPDARVCGSYMVGLSGMDPVTAFHVRLPHQQRRRLRLEAGDDGETGPAGAASSGDAERQSPVAVAVATKSY